ncbi:MAG: serine/threonine-protein kinase [Acidobacteriota bacterium]
MESERWERAQEIFFAALEQPEGERAAFVDRTCAEDADLRAEVALLLEGHGTGPFVLDEPIALDPNEWPTALADGPPSPSGVGVPSERLGPYRLIAPIGRGGMGVVYRAVRDDAYRQEVAIKVLATGTVDPEVAIRFRSERQILANLRHPHIARLLDGGTTPEGFPYLVMELVAGQPIDRHCLRSGLDTEARLSLFLKVCEAVQFAHRNLVVHRDLKPGNILVDSDGTPKLLDFGIAKLLDPTADFEHTILDTAPGRSPLTLAYASPEQIRSDPVTTATDVYALGVLLYLMLTGQHPHDTTAPAHELARSICESEPTRPSTTVRQRRDWRGPRDESARLARRLEGDLDTIVQTALRIEPERRYASVDLFAQDIERHLRGLPVTARDDTFVYRAGKFVRRHRAGVVATAAIFVLLIASITMLLTERRRTRAQWNRAETVSAFMIDLFEQADPGRSRGETLKVRDMLDQGAGRIRRLRDEPETQADLMETMANVYQNLGLYDDAQSLLDEAHGLRLDLHGAGDLRVLANLEQRGALLLDRGELAAAETLFRRVLDRRRAVHGATAPELVLPVYKLAAAVQLQDRHDEASVLYQEMLDLGAAEGADAVVLASGYNALATLERERGRFERALSLHRKALSLLDDQPRPDPDIAVYTRNVATVLRDQGDLERAETVYREALGMQRRLYEEDHPSLATTLANLGDLLRERGTFDEAREMLDEALSMRRAVYGDDHPQVAAVWSGVGNLAHAERRLADAEAAHRQALRLRREHFGEDHSEVAESLSNLAITLNDQGHLDEAAEHYTEALDFYRRFHGDRHEKVALLLNNLAQNHRLRGNDREAEALYRQAITIQRDLLGTDHPVLAASWHNLGTVLRRLDEEDAADDAFSEALDIVHGHLGPSHPWACTMARSLASLRAQRGAFESAEQLGRDTLPVCASTLGEAHRTTAAVHGILGYALLEQGEHAEAEEHLWAIYRHRLTAEGPDGAGTRRARDRLQALYAAWGRPSPAELTAGAEP